MKNIFKNKKIVVAAVIILLTVLFILYKKLNPAPLEVKQTQATSQKLFRTLTYSGEVISKYEQTLSFPASGKVTFFDKTEGNTVEQDEVVARIDSYTNYASYQQSINTVTKLQSDLAELKRNFEINPESFNDSIEVYYLQKEQLEEQIKNAQLDVQKYSLNFSNYNLNSTINGTLVEKNIEVGETATAAIAVAKVADLNNLLFKVNVDAEDIKKVKISQKVIVILDSEPDREIEGHVEEIAEIAKDDGLGNKTIEVKIKLNENGLLLGEEGDAKIVLEETTTQVVSVPFDSVVKDGEKAYVYKIVNKILEKTEVKLGTEADLDYEITSNNIKQGDNIVLNPNTELKNGKKVVVK